LELHDTRFTYADFLSFDETRLVPLARTVSLA
jgi:hypothetical protein